MVQYAPIMRLLYTDKQTDDVSFSIKVKRQLASHKSEIQQIVILETYGFGRAQTPPAWLVVSG